MRQSLGERLTRPGGHGSCALVLPRALLHPADELVKLVLRTRGEVAALVSSKSPCQPSHVDVKYLLMWKVGGGVPFLFEEAPLLPPPPLPMDFSVDAISP